MVNFKILALITWMGSFMALSSAAATCITTTQGEWSDSANWDCGCDLSSCDTLVVAHSMTTIADTLHIPVRLLVITESGSLFGQNFSIPADVHNHRQMVGNWMRFFGEGAFLNYGSVNAHELLAIQDSCVNHGTFLATDSLVIGYYKALKNHGQVDCNVIYNLSFLFNVGAASRMTANRFEGNWLGNEGLLEIANELLTYGGMTNYGTVRTGSWSTWFGGFENRGLVQCADTLSNGDGVFSPLSENFPPGLIETTHFINRTGARLQGSGVLCISGTSINEGALQAQVRICDTSPTSTEWPYLDVNTGTVTNDVVVCTAGYCSVGMAELFGAEELLVYPNPAVNSVSVEFGRLRSEAGSLRLVNALGQTVRTITFPRTERYTFSRDALPSGHYQLIISDRSGKPIARSAVVFLDR